MKLTAAENELFFDLYHSLLLFTNQQRRIFPRLFTRRGLKDASLHQFKILRGTLYQHINLLDEFIVQNPFHFSATELDIVADWKRSILGRFFVFLETTDCTIFLSNIKPIKAYGVVALNKNFSAIFQEPLPIYIETVLLPFANKIITDGIFSRYRLNFGDGFTRNLQQSYQKALDQWGLITFI
ncbi:MAG: hypothetical protein ONB16_02150 [candidate division KSB1 bacterium]|nr:hypothetical protein [candidate division KSB1 bacterium]MDZ7318779.1 hypothetical protein [candidate division KSB1 bacterium]MDZ7341475.1 hypothetical protein [candidate division KSB1 bacterium]